MISELTTLLVVSYYPQATRGGIATSSSIVPASLTEFKAAVLILSRGPSQREALR